MLHSHQQCMRILFVLHPHTYLMLSVLQVLAILVGMHSFEFWQIQFFVIISTSNFSTCSGQKPWYHPWLLSFFHTSLLMYQQFLLILPLEYVYHSPTSSYPHCHPRSKQSSTLIITNFLPGLLVQPLSLAVCSLTRTHSLDHASSQLKTFQMSLPSHLEWKSKSFLSSSGSCRIWIYGYFLYMFSHGLISNITLFLTTVYINITHIP